MADRDTEHRRPRRLRDERLAEMRRRYGELIGFVPPRIHARVDVVSRVDPDGLELQEAVRSHFMYPKCFVLRRRTSAPRSSRS